MSLTKAGIAIRKSNMLGKAAAVYVCNGRGELARHDFKSLAEARRVAKETSAKSGWPISDDPTREGFGSAFGGSPIARGAAAVKAALAPSGRGPLRSRVNLPTRK